MRYLVWQVAMCELKSQTREASARSLPLQGLRSGVGGAFLTAMSGPVDDPAEVGISAAVTSA
jgi:hypothetical protein